jgi:hypothetical protein
MQEMKELEVTQKINYKWWGTNIGQNIEPEHEKELKEHALERIEYMMKEGFTSGDLILDIYPEDSDDGTGYNGWWSVTEE